MTTILDLVELPLPPKVEAAVRQWIQDLLDEMVQIREDGGQDWDLAVLRCQADIARLRLMLPAPITPGAALDPG